MDAAALRRSPPPGQYLHRSSASLALTVASTAIRAEPLLFTNSSETWSIRGNLTWNLFQGFFHHEPE